MKPVDARCLVKDEAAQSAGPLAIFGFRTTEGQEALAVWRTQDRPGLDSRHRAVALTCRGVHLSSTPVYVDLLTRAVYTTLGVVEAPGGDEIRVLNLPVYDSPVLLIDPALVEAQ